MNEQLSNIAAVQGQLLNIAANLNGLGNADAARLATKLRNQVRELGKLLNDNGYGD